MSAHEETIASLREALRVSPENVPLRRHLADTLLRHGSAEDAATEYRAALQHAPRDAGLKLGLARAYFQMGKYSHAGVVVEELLQLADAPPGAYLLSARLLFKEGEVERAVRHYRQAVEQDATVADSAFAERLGIDADPADPTADVIDGRQRAVDGDEPPEVSVELERPHITFADVGGMDRVKDEVRMKIIHPLDHAELYAAYGKKIGGGVLMYGPPGCGKTHLARATAGEVHAGFLAVGINEVLEMWIGQSERNLHAIFEQAREHAPCVLFFDEVDALAASRADMRHSGGRQIINQFLAELDGVKDSNEGVLILAATNAPWHLDAAFRRPGRFDRVIFVPPPDAAARAAILKIHLKGKPAGEVDFEQVARKADGFSGADLRAVIDVAVEAKLRAAIESGVPQPLATRDLLSAAAKLKPTTREWFATARNYALYSNTGGMYDDIVAYLKLR